MADPQILEILKFFNLLKCKNERVFNVTDYESIQNSKWRIQNGGTQILEILKFFVYFFKYEIDKVFEVTDHTSNQNSKIQNGGFNMEE